MNSLKMKLLDELMNHLSGMQGMDLKKLMDSEKDSGAGVGPEDPMADEMGDKPKGLAIEKVSVMGKPKMDGMDDAAEEASESPEMEAMEQKNGGEDDEMSDEELKELLAKLV